VTAEEGLLMADNGGSEGKYATWENLEGSVTLLPDFR
jgi:hypothetical protein